MRWMRWLGVCLAWLLAVVATPLHAQDVLPVPPLSGRVIDQTSTLTPAQVQALSGPQDRQAKVRNRLVQRREVHVVHVERRLHLADDALHGAPAPLVHKRMAVQPNSRPGR